ncbi:MAG: hypothetical protein V4641_30385, partial [Pseudomonadota bacterium]
MNLRGIANGVIQIVNSNLTIDLLRSTGYATGANGKQIPTYATLNGEAQVQALGPKDLQHLNNLN